MARLQLAISILMHPRDDAAGPARHGSNPQARTRLAHEQIDEKYIEVPSLWRHRTFHPDWTQHKLYLALGRLGVHSGRTPDWLILWRGWEKLQLMIDGARVAKLGHQQQLNRANQKRCLACVRKELFRQMRTERFACRKSVIGPPHCLRNAKVTAIHFLGGRCVRAKVSSRRFTLRAK